MVDREVIRGFNIGIYKHLVAVPYRSRANGLAERHMAEIMKHLRVLVVEKRIKAYWSHYLPLA